MAHESQMLTHVVVYVFPVLGSPQMEVLGRKLEQELAHDARVIACRFPFPRWHASASEGQGLDQAWAYDMATVHKHPAWAPTNHCNLFHYCQMVIYKPTTLTELNWIIVFIMLTLIYNVKSSDLNIGFGLSGSENIGICKSQNVYLKHIRCSDKPVRDVCGRNLESSQIWWKIEVSPNSPFSTSNILWNLYFKKNINIVYLFNNKGFPALSCLQKWCVGLD